MKNVNIQRRSIIRLLKRSTCLLLAGLLTVGSPLMADEPVEVQTSDVALNAGGLLQGTVLNTAAQPIVGVAVNVLHEDKVVATSTSNEQGEFTIKGLRNGAHVVTVGTTQQAVRLWGADTAPPAAVKNIAIVVDEETVRGQMGMPSVRQSGGFLGNNFGALLLIGGAVAITLGTTLDNNAAPASP